MEYIPSDEQQNNPLHLVVCCQCGTPIEPNPANTCVACLRTLVDITEGIPKQATLYFCKGCERYLQPPSTWLSAALESRELLAICLKRLKGLNKVHLVDAGFIWTEPHSKRVKVKLTVQKEVFSGAILQQVFIVEYIVHGQMCDECHRREAKDYWNSVVQVRQKVSHKKTLFYLEQLLLKHQAHHSALRVKGNRYGLDFFYAHKQEAVKLVEFLVAAIPCHSKASQELISHDTHNNTYNYKHTFSVEIVPICKDSLMCLPLKLSQLLGNINQLVLCHRITSSVQLVDPQSTQTVELSSQVYWRMPFISLCEQRQLVEFFVVQIEPTSIMNNKFLLADCWVTRVRDLGATGHQIHTRTHLGRLLHPGDTVLGYDLTTTNINNTNYEKLKSPPDIVLVRKVYGDGGKRHKTRNWKLQQLNKEIEEDMDTDDYDKDYKDFLDDLEEDKEYRQQVNIYFDPLAGSHVAEERAGLDVDIPTIKLDEMLGGLTLHDKP